MSLELLLLGGVFSEDQYDKVSFIEPKDFKKQLHSFFWSCLQANNGNVLKAIAELEFNERKDLSHSMTTYSTLLSTNNIENIALNMLEIRFKTLLSSLLGNLSKDCQSSLEMNLINEYKEAIKEHDIFILNDGILEYFGYQVSDYTKQRITDYLKWVDMRCKKAKEVINGTR